MSEPVATRSFRPPLFLRSLAGLVLAPLIGGAVVFGAIGVLELAKGRIELLRMAGLGGYFGARIVRSMNEKAVRNAILVYAWGLTGYFFLRLYLRVA